MDFHDSIRLVVERRALLAGWCYWLLFYQRTVTGTSVYVTVWYLIYMSWMGGARPRDAQMKRMVTTVVVGSLML